MAGKRYPRDLGKLLKDPEFWERYEAACEGVAKAAATVGAKRYRAGTVAATVLAYYRSPEFLLLSISTQSTYRGILDRFAREFGDYPLKQLQREHVKAIIAKMIDRPHAANNLLRMLRLLLDFAIDEGLAYETFIRRAETRMLNLYARLSEAPFLRQAGLDADTFVKEPIARQGGFDV